MRVNLPPPTPEEREAINKIIDEGSGDLLDSLRDMGINITVISADDPRVRPPMDGGCISS